MAHIPYGYRIEKGVALLEQEKALQVQQMFEEYQNGLGLQAIADKLQMHCSHSKIGRILDHPVYMGTDFYPAIIEKSQWEEVAEKRKEKAILLGRDKATRKNIKESDLNGLVYCKKCGSPYKRYRIKGNIKWLCSRNYNGWVEHCDSPVFTEEQLQQAFMDFINNLNLEEISEKPKDTPMIIEEKYQDPLKQAEYAYSHCKVEDFTYQTNKLLQYLKQKPTSFDGSFMKKIIKRMTISENSFSFELINHKIMERRNAYGRESSIRNTSESEI